MIGRLLCKIGWHRYRCGPTERLPFGYYRDTTACRRPGCTISYTYTTHRSDPVNW